MTRLPLLAIVFAASCAQREVRAPNPVRYERSAVSTAMTRHARGAVDAGDGDYRIRVLRQKIAESPADVASRLELAERYRAAGYPDVALEHLRAAGERFPNDPRVAVRLAKELRHAGLRTEALSALSSYNEAHPGDADVLAWLGILCDELNRLPEGEKHHRAAIALRPDADFLHNNLGYNLQLQGRSSEAAAELRRAIDLSPRSTVARNNLGVALAEKPEEAVAAWKSVVGPAAAHNNMAAVYIEQGRYEEARRELELALGYRRDQPEVLSNLGLLNEVESGAVRLDATGGGWKRIARSTYRVIFGDPVAKPDAKPFAPSPNDPVRSAGAQ